ncbi:MAG: hypothetical protein GXP13_07910 [Gammaproteobacteria bacterium]|nr:hypothetical protein [Gammaproteobacteria bacterium]
MAKLLYSGSLPDKLNKGTEDMNLPNNVNIISGLLAILRKRGGGREKALIDDLVQITINRKFTEPGSPVTDNSGITIISPTLN